MSKKPAGIETLSLTPRVQFMNVYPLSEPERLDFTGTSCGEVMETLREWLGTAGNHPVLLTKEHLFALQGISAATKLLCWRQLAVAVALFGRVEVHLED